MIDRACDFPTSSRSFAHQKMQRAKYVDAEPSHGSWGSEEQSGGTVIEFTDAFSLSDAVLTDKTLILLDSVEASRAVLTDNGLILSDILDLNDEVLAHKTFPIADSLTLNDQVLTHKTFPIPRA